MVSLSTSGGPLPVGGTGLPNGIDIGTFFDKHASLDIAMLDGERVEPLLETARRYAPIDLSVVGKIQLYLVWESVQQSEEAAKSGKAFPQMLVFASPAVPYFGSARYNHAKYGYARFAKRVI